jgi:hypothetical protein
VRCQHAQRPSSGKRLSAMAPVQRAGLGGALFGPLAGVLLGLAEATAGATVAFLLARSLAADWVERRLGQRLQEIKAGVEREGWREDGGDGWGRGGDYPSCCWGVSVHQGMTASGGPFIYARAAP